MQVNHGLSAIAMNQNPFHHEANKHVAIADHFAREQVELGVITISHMRTGDLPADALAHQGAAQGPISQTHPNLYELARLSIFLYSHHC